MEWFLAAPALILLTAGLVGQAFEMRRIKAASYGGDLGSPRIFLDRRNLKWYGLIGIGIVMWYMAERM